MTRRALFQTLIGLIAVGSFRLTRPRFGYLNVYMAQARGFLPARIYLNGQCVDNVTEVDDIEGWVKAYKTDSNGTYMIDASGDSIATEVLHGHVEYWPNGTYLSTIRTSREHKISGHVKEMFK